MDLFFFYGTLKNAGSRGGIFEDRLEFVGEGETPGLLYSVRSGGFPCAVFDRDENSTIHGEVYRLTSEEHREDVLASLDMIEGVSAGLYVRREIPVLTEDGNPVVAISYEAGPLLLRSLDTFPLIQGGVF